MSQESRDCFEDDSALKTQLTTKPSEPKRVGWSPIARAKGWPRVRAAGDDRSRDGRRASPRVCPRVSSKVRRNAGPRPCRKVSPMISLSAGLRPSPRTDHRSFVPTRMDTPVQARYKYDDIVDRIGEGGFGQVFVAQDRRVPGRKVAIKSIQLTRAELKNKTFRDEIHIMKELDHPHICRILELYERSPLQCRPGSRSALVYLVMEYCEGGDAFDRVHNCSGLSEADTARIVQQTSSALSYAHGKGIAHRDLKLENLCFCSTDASDLNLKVIDWGLGCIFQRSQMTSSVGSPGYTAPEVIWPMEDGHYTHACDVWSLGVATYVMLSGKFPFPDWDENSTRPLCLKVPFHSKPWHHVSDACRDFIVACLRQVPDARPTMAELLHSPWLRTVSRSLRPEVAVQVMANMRHFAQAGQFFSVFTAAVARNLDHKSLKDIHHVFCELDSNGDGVLELCEIKAGFESVYGKSSVEAREIEDLFWAFDLNGSGSIDYTEFCAAGIGLQSSTREDVLWAAFKAFDVQEDEMITRKGFEQVLCENSRSLRDWTKEGIDDLMAEFKEYDEDGDGMINFNEWLAYMHAKSRLHRPASDISCVHETDFVHQGLEADKGLVDYEHREQFEDKSRKSCCGDVSDLCVVS